jgi:hypothetical protein
MFIAKNNNLIILANNSREQLEQQLQFVVYTSIEETDVEYQFYGNEGYLTVEEIAQKEAERIARLHLTRGDVFRGLLQAKGVTRTQLRAMIEAMPDGIDKEMALIDFDEALEFYRGVALVDTIGLVLGITSNQMTKFFETNDFEELTREEII